MKKFLVAAIGLGLVLSTVSPVLAQDTAPKNTQMTFRRMIDDTGRGNWRQSSDKPVVVPCKGTALAHKAENGSMDIPVEGGVHVLKQLIVSGTSVQFDFN